MTESILTNQFWKRMAQLTIQAIEPSMRGRVSYLLDNHEATRIKRDFDCALLQAGGWTSSMLDMMLYPEMVQRGLWSGRSFAAVIDTDRKDTFESAMGTTLHEFGHFISDDVYTFALKPHEFGLASGIATEKFTKRNYKDDGQFEPAPADHSWQGHGFDYVRAACHLAYRGQNLIPNLDPSFLRFGRQYYSVDEAAFMKPLRSECVKRKDESIRQILKTPAPIEFTKLWHTVAGVPMPAPSKPAKASPLELYRIARKMPDRFIRRRATYKPMAIRRDIGGGVQGNVVVLMDETPRPGSDGVPVMYLMSGYEERPNHPSISMMTNPKSQSVRDCCGSVRSLTIQNNQLVGVVVFARTEDSQVCYQKFLAEGRPLELQTEDLEGWIVPRGKSYNGVQGPLTVVTRWRPMSAAMTGNDAEFKENSFTRYKCDDSCAIKPDPEHIEFVKKAGGHIFDISPDGRMSEAKDCGCKTKSKTGAACSCNHL